MILCSTAEETEVPSEVEALDGLQGEDEAHNASRPARKSIKKKGPKGKPISEFSVGESVSGKVKTLTSYGAFIDIGASTDALLHISQLSVEFVSDVNEVLKQGQDVDVRIINIDEKKGQIGLSLLSEAQEEEAKEAAAAPRQRRQERNNSSNQRRDDSAILAQLNEKGFDSEKFVEGTVVSIVDFGAFVRIDAKQLNEEVEGELDGLVHISALTSGRANSVSSIVSTNEKVQVRVKAIEGNKVSLSMISVEDETSKNEAQSSSAAASVGAKDWKESLEKMKGVMPQFKNMPLVVDLRK